MVHVLHVNYMGLLLLKQLCHYLPSDKASVNILYKSLAGAQMCRTCQMPRCAEPYKVQFTIGAHDMQQKQAYRSHMIFRVAVELLVQTFSLQDCPVLRRCLWRWYSHLCDTSI